MFTKEEVSGILIALSCAEHESQIDSRFAKQIEEKCEKMYPGIVLEMYGPPDIGEDRTCI